MVSGNSPGKDMVDRLADVLSSPVLNVLVGMAGIAMPLVAWASHRAEATGIVLAAETTLLVCVVVSHAWLRRSHALVRRPDGRRMSDPAYFDLVHRHIESDVVADFEELADGHLTAYGGASSQLVALLLRTLTESQAQPKVALATDLVAPPGAAGSPAGVPARESPADRGRRGDPAYPDQLVRRSGGRAVLARVARARR